MAGIDGNFFVFREYLDAAFVGQQLCQISTIFTYSVPCANKPQCFSFQITIYDKMLLAVTLYFLAKGLYAKNDPELVDKNNNGTALKLCKLFSPN